MCIENFVYETALISAGYIDTENPSPIISLLYIGHAKRGRAVPRGRFMQQKDRQCGGPQPDETAG